MIRIALIVSIAFAAAVSAAETTPCDVRVVLRDGSELRESIIESGPCLEDWGNHLERDLVAVRGATSHKLVIGRGKFKVHDQQAPASNATLPVKFDVPFERKPWLITRVMEMQLSGDPRCAKPTRAFMSKKDVSVEGFTFVFGVREGCLVESFTGEWLAFTIDPAEVAADVPRPWVNRPDLMGSEPPY